MRRITLNLLSLYKRWLSPSLTLIFGHACRFSPTCSEYSYQAIEKYGFIKGIPLSLKRILRCNPLSKPGYDPIIENI